MINESKIKGLFKLKLEGFKDKRGFFYETFNKKKYLKIFRKVNLIQDDISISKKRVFRGFHGDFKTYKLTSCIFGEMIFFFVDNRKKSSTFNKVIKFKVSNKVFYQFLVPPGVGMATYTLSKISYLSYKQSKYYDKNSQFTIKLNKYPKILKQVRKKIIISKRDSF